MNSDLIKLGFEYGFAVGAFAAGLAIALCLGFLFLCFLWELRP